MKSSYTDISCDFLSCKIRAEKKSPVCVTSLWAVTGQQSLSFLFLIMPCQLNVQFQSSKAYLSCIGCYGRVYAICKVFVNQVPCKKKIQACPYNMVDKKRKNCKNGTHVDRSCDQQVKNAQKYHYSRNLFIIHYLVLIPFDFSKVWQEPYYLMEKTTILLRQSS